MITQETCYIGGALCRLYESSNGRMATVNTSGQVFGYPNASAFMDGESDYSVWGSRPTNAGNELAISYVIGGN
jgi:hypothetical protein